MPVKDETKVLEEINRNVEEKGFIVWLKEERLTVQPDVLAQFLDPALAKSYMMSRSGASGVVWGQSNVSPHSPDQQGHGLQPPERIRGHGCEDWNVQQQQSYFHYAIPASAKQDSVTGKLVFKSKIRYGNISLEKRDLKFLSPDHEFQGILCEMQRDFRKQYRYTDEVEVKIMFVPANDMHLVFYGDHGVEMANNDLLLLKTRVINGKISFCDSDVEFCFPNWTVPGYITESLKKKACNGTIIIISDEKGNLRTFVKRGTKEELIGLKDKAVTAICAPLSYKKSQK